MKENQTYRVNNLATSYTIRPNTDNIKVNVGDTVTLTALGGAFSVLAVVKSFGYIETSISKGDRVMKTSEYAVKLESVGMLGIGYVTLTDFTNNFVRVWR